MTMDRRNRERRLEAPPGGAARPARAAFRAIVFALALVAAHFAAAAGDVDVRKGGSLWARIERGGTVSVAGTIVGEIGTDGGVRVGGSIEGRVENDGTIRDGGTIRGRVEKDGTLRLDGAIVGRIEDDGAIRRNGSIWGSASPCCPTFDDARRIAALLYFFESGFFLR